MHCRKVSIFCTLVKVTFKSSANDEIVDTYTRALRFNGELIATYTEGDLSTLTFAFESLYDTISFQSSLSDDLGFANFIRDFHYFPHA